MMEENVARRQEEAGEEQAQSPGPVRPGQAPQREPGAPLGRQGPRSCHSLGLPSCHPEARQGPREAMLRAKATPTGAAWGSG